jgi:hypothetical protein
MAVAVMGGPRIGRFWGRDDARDVDGKPLLGRVAMRKGYCRLMPGEGRFRMNTLEQFLFLLLPAVIAAGGIGAVLLHRAPRQQGHGRRADPVSRRARGQRPPRA